ncbi:PilT/PilU family type 4a pilus ATPase [Candidatus Dojkabacteria bacterium]|uniref:PilT/PilU family type 4a pilus ATPase n=1 Tax=Candidatus Dojkabacteria bacterium TaxID=2099670 RepID=A0A3M0YZ42_9BACT|nr:MAG: PilT/PilU family type 4a pilus ATPase [Candidatus Dojkabacteria bacterium]
MPIKTVKSTLNLNQQVGVPGIDRPGDRDRDQQSVDKINKPLLDSENLESKMILSYQGDIYGDVDNDASTELEMTRTENFPVSPLNSSDVLVTSKVSKVDKPVIKSYNLIDILNEALQIGASDVHLSLGYRAFARKNKKLVMLRSQILNNQSIQSYINEINRFLGNNSSVNIFSYLVNNDHYDTAVDIFGHRIRVNIVKVSGSYSISLRLIPSKIRSLEELKLPVNLENLIKFKNGLVLVTGSTGSGKSTTLAALINKINTTETKKIITLEDPVEYIYPKSLSLVVQRNFGTDFYDWKDGIKSAMRQDPNIILIGEIRDSETLNACLNAAETGHLVFATLHTNSASATIQRLIDMFDSEQKSYAKSVIASCLRAVLTQHLYPAFDGNSMIPVIELLYVNHAIQNIIKQELFEQINNVISTSASEGMILFENYYNSLKAKNLI